MPNHVNNTLTFHGNPERIAELIASVKGKDTDFDFNTLIPMPESLNIESGSRGEDGLVAYKEYLRTGIKPKKITNRYGYEATISDEAFELGKQYYENMAKYGCATWYNWSWDNWGTKWNAYDTWADDTHIGFNTAWNAPCPVIHALSKKFPDITIEHEYADEDIGYNCGRTSYKDGVTIDWDFDEGSEEAVRFACDMWGYDYDEYMDEING